jgi:hypothetical protein
MSESANTFGSSSHTGRWWDANQHGTERNIRLKQVCILGEGGFWGARLLHRYSSIVPDTSPESEREGLPSTLAYVGAQAVKFLLYHLVAFTDPCLQA